MVDVAKKTAVRYTVAPPDFDAETLMMAITAEFSYGFFKTPERLTAALNDSHKGSPMYRLTIERVETTE